MVLAGGDLYCGVLQTAGYLGWVGCRIGPATRLFRYFSERVRMSSEDWEFMKGKRPRSLKVNKVFLQDLTVTKEVRMWWRALTGCHSPP